MEFVFELLFQFLGELLLQAIFEALFELGLHSLADTLKRPKNPVLSTFGFILWGGIAGGISLLIFPTSPIVNPLLRKINLIATPICAGALMAMVGRTRSKRGQSLVRVDRFGYAFIFAFAMALVRFIWAA
ncbi:MULTISPECIES: hypothetical protein [unclassified Sphingobium]|uniref:hypothetical protein n=1 Tax=unclassified Sphingobium TaxID=2611147 RepID=UPI00065C9668|nr:MULTISPECIES: hypothetical protein [unclassified Sphingobium]UXC90145.1 hypothetical protein EGM87_13950 [Sphingobium sp. RSMS]